MIIGLSGFAGSGKGTVAQYLVQNYDYTEISFADSLKDACAAIFGWPRYLLQGDTSESRAFRETSDNFWTKKLGYYYTPRIALQEVGTDLFRNKFYNDIWVSSIERKLENIDRAVISDVRFLNEILMLKSLNAKLAIVVGKSRPAWFDEVMNNNFTESAHRSEWDWLVNREHYKYRIKNQSDFSDLHSNIENFLDDIYSNLTKS